MNILHAKSSCCHAQIWHHGIRRRRCSECGRTWVVRKKRRGRKRNRCTGKKVIGYFEHRVRTVSKYQLRQELKYFLAHTPQQVVPLRKKLIVIADAFYARVEKKRVTVYITLIRPVDDSTAIILPPTLGGSVESYEGWRAHFGSVPPRITRRLVAAVCDGRTGLVALLREHDLVIQRCHFHFLARLQMKRSKLPSSRHYGEGVRLYHLAQAALTAPESVAKTARNKLVLEARGAPRGLRTVLSGFVVNYEDYRAYQRYPLLRLPRTTGSAESLISSIRDLLRQLRGVRTRVALEKWLIAYFKYRRTIQCNSQHK